VGLTQSLLVSNLEFAEAQIYESQQRRESKAALRQTHLADHSQLPVKPADQPRHRNVEGVADSKQGHYRNRSPRFNLLPVTRGKAE
jgi:hypothetical protein